MSVSDWRTIPSLSALRAFEMTARAGNFAGAARTLNVTHAAVAQQVRALEAELGVPLARRSGRTVALTEAGARLAAHLGEGFDAIARGIEELRENQDTRPVQVSVTPFVAQAVVLPRLHEFWSLHPGIQVAMVPSLDMVDLAANGLDLAIRTSPDPPDWPGVDTAFLCDSRTLVAGAPGLVGGGIPELSDMPWIWTRGCVFEEGRLRAVGLDPDRLKNVDLGSPFLEFAAAREGLALIVSPEILVRDDLASGRLCEVPVTGLRGTRYYAVTPKGSIRPQAASFIDWLKPLFAGEFSPPGNNRSSSTMGSALT